MHEFCLASFVSGAVGGIFVLAAYYFGRWQDRRAVMADWLDDLDDHGFFAAMQTYRLAPIQDQAGVTKAFESVKVLIRKRAGELMW